MLMVLLGAAIGLLVAGLAALGFGIYIKEFGLGNTLIQAGTVAICSGLLMVGLWVVARELQALVQRLSAGATAAVQPPLAAAPALAPPPTRDQPPADPAAATEAPPWREDR